MLLVAVGHEAEACLFLDRSEVGNGELNKHFKPAFSLDYPPADGNRRPALGRHDISYKNKISNIIRCPFRFSVKALRAYFGCRRNRLAQGCIRRQTVTAVYT